MRETHDVTFILRNNTNVTNILVVFDVFWPNVEDFEISPWGVWTVMIFWWEFLGDGQK